MSLAHEQISPVRRKAWRGALGGCIVALLAAGLSGAVSLTTASAEPVVHPNGFDVVDSNRAVFYRGQRYCWYDLGWNGSGWYRCGYAWRRGFGWGGYYGWHGWHGGHPRPPVHHHPGHHPPGPPRPGHPHHGHPQPGHPHPGPGKPGAGKPPGPGGPTGGPGRPPRT